MGLLERGIRLRRAPSAAVTVLPPPDRVVLPLLWGERPLVRPGQRVLRGQRIADGGGTLPLHASVSGTVVDMGHHRTPDGLRRPALVVESDGAMEPSPAQTRRAVLDDLDDAALLSLLYEAGIRLPDGTPLADAAADAGPGLQTLILCAMDGEPDLCTEDAVLCSDGETALSGIRLLERLLRPRRVLLAVGARQKQAAAAAGRWCGGRLQLAMMPERYPYAHPQLLAEELGGQMPGQTSREAGVLVLPVTAAAAAGLAAYDGLPAVDVPVCVAWDGGRAVYRVPAGTPVRAVLRAAGQPAEHVLLGGPMTGRELVNPDGPILQGFPGLTVRRPDRPLPATACIRCGRCAAVCPVDLLPWMSQLRRAQPVWHGCLDCGACQYVCPANLPLLDAMGRRTPAAVG